ncbi:MAG: hypothetical protein HYS12_20055 [Planctomycetes bacterium]|nr:hypothetical protein [Planctomycetota bacterium]
MSTADKPVGSHATPTDITPAAAGTSPAPASSPTAVTERPGAAPDGDAIKLPPQKPRAAAPGGVSTLVHVLDAVLLVLVLALAVFVAAAPIRDSDVLRHLATGQALVDGRYNPVVGTDPFAATTEGVPWVNPSWLYELLSYGVYSTANRIHEGAGIPALAVLNALLVAVLALILVRIGRGAGGPVVSILCVALALLVMSPRLSLDPAVVSLFFLGLTLWLLQRGGRWLAVPGHTVSAAPGEPVTWKDYWPLLPLFALWANLDEWFLLGPLTVGLYALGQALQSESGEQKSAASTPRPGEVRALGVIFVAGLAACLLNPHHVFVFAVPSGLGFFSATVDALKKDQVLGETFILPVQEPFLPGRLSVAGLAYFPLILFGLLSFGLNYNNLRWWRVLLFGFFLLLSAVAGRAVPFFAVIAGLVMALNFHELSERQQAARGGRERRERAGGRALVGLALLLLLAAGWSGRLHAEPYEQHRVCFANELDPSFERAAKWIREQHEQGRLGKGFVFGPDFADALALYCPEEKGFLDHRYRLFGGVAADFVAVRNALLRPAGPEKKDWQQVLEKHGVDHIVLYAPAAEGVEFAYRNLMLEPRAKEPKEWVELYRDGRTVVFGWAKKRPAYREHGLDVERLAYSSATVQKVPQDGMPYLPGSEPFWMPFLKSAGPRPLESDEAALHVLAFEVEMRRTRHQRSAGWQAVVTAGVLAEVRPSPVPMAPSFLLLPSLAQAYEGLKEQPPKLRLLAKGAFELHNHFMRSFPDSASPAHLLLAVRAARRALAKNPDDAQAHLQLGKAYLYLSRATRERGLERDPNRSLLGDLRSIQAIASFNQAVLLNPNLEEAHGGLIQLYGKQPGFKDLQLRHTQGFLKATRSAGPRPGEDRAQFDDRVKELTAGVNTMEEEVQKKQDSFTNRKEKLGKVLNRAQTAQSLDLAGEALKILRDSEVTEFGHEGMQMQIELALRMGLVRDLRIWFDLDEKEEKDFIANLVQRNETPKDGFLRYYRFKGLLAGATGEYAAADRCFAEIETGWGQVIDSFDLHRHLGGFPTVTGPKDYPVLGATTAGLLGSPLGQGPLLAASTLFPGRPGVKKDQSGLPGIKEALSLSVVRLILASSTPPQRKFDPRQAMQAIVGDLDSLLEAISERAQYTALRGVLAVEAGDLVKAERLFRQALADPAFIGIDFPYRSMAEEYLQKLTKKQRKTAAANGSSPEVRR